MTAAPTVSNCVERRVCRYVPYYIAWQLTSALSYNHSSHTYTHTHSPSIIIQISSFLSSKHQVTPSHTTTTSTTARLIYSLNIHAEGVLELEERNINRTVSAATVLCTIITVHNRTTSSYRSVDWIGLLTFRCLALIFQTPLYLWPSWCWPLTWLTNHCPYFSAITLMLVG